MGKIIEFGTGKERSRFVKFFDYFTEDPFWADFDLAEQVVYAKLLNKMIIAEYNGQKDSSGKIYCQMTIEEIMKVAKVKKTKAKAILKKLSDKHLLRIERPNKRDANYLYVREYIPEDESLRVTERLSSGSENGPHEGHETALNTKKEYKIYKSYKKINDSQEKVKRNFGGFSQREYQPNFYAELEKRLCGSG